MSADVVPRLQAEGVSWAPADRFVLLDLDLRLDACERFVDVGLEVLLDAAEVSAGGQLVPGKDDGLVDVGEWVGGGGRHGWWRTQGSTGRPVVGSR